MRFSASLAAAAAAVAPLASAHDSPGLPNLVGLNVRDLKARSLMDTLRARAVDVVEHAHVNEKRGSLQPRQGGTDGQCGGSFGSCAAGYCCSESGCMGSACEPTSRIG